MRWGLILLFACGSSSVSVSEPEPVQPSVAEPTVSEPAGEAPPATPSCLDVGEPSELDGFWPTAVGRIDGTTWGTRARTTGSGTWTTEVIALDGTATGLVRADLGVQLVGPTSRAFVDGRGVRVVWSTSGSTSGGRGDPMRTVRVDVTDPDRPAVSDVVDLADVPDGWVQRAAGDGDRFIFSMTEADADRTAGTHRVLLFEGTREVRRWEAPAAAVFCHGACGFAAFEQNEASLTVGDRTSTQTLNGVCAAVPFRGPDETAIVLLSPSGYAGWRVAPDGALRGIDPVAWDEPRACDVRAAQDSWVAGRRWLRWDGGLREESFESEALRHPHYAPLGDALAVVEIDASSEMQHSPTDSRGRRRYFRRWQLNGASARLVPGGSATEVPIPSAEGMGTEPDFAVFVRDGRAALLALHSPVAAGRLVPIAAPCPP